ncbi:N-acetyl-gamma-glutamyl-phosphate reductase [Pectinatus haikarae]|uniref:N-acetyl-gamma-glutamyl-phosphate reductase n=1 Tax=Pectinatus haikarae TaxID=349096 RepID=A0ABT9Y497_9FIRM|nr:N-acetyl-gamma-glutamyl-phosphate reductase [Pectinatus haikarae]MDQ0202655.1 N-acetyl-gamma-glutamyl-phosphate reductase [Pectinatus haikarae]
MKVSIIGATGYAGVELLRILHNHPEADIAYLTSESSAGKKISDIYEHLRGIYDQVLISMDNIQQIAAESDFLFICLPHGHAMQVGKTIENQNTRIIDLGADYRFTDTAVYEEWYRVKHTHKNAARVYGLAELHRQEIKTAKIIGNAGCYTTASILALAPLVREGLIDPSTIIIDAKSGVSGAGRSAKLANHFPELYDSFKAYAVSSHRHTPEIEQELSSLAGEHIILNFTPHLLPMSRGILSTCYANLTASTAYEKIDDAFIKAYGSEFFIRLLGRGTYPATKNVRGSNFCDIGWHIDERTGRVIVLSAIDNLVKGAAGQAVQNFNIACGFEENTGLLMTPIYP